MTFEDVRTVEAMHRFGGKFAQHLAAAAVAADDENLSKIKSTFHEIWHRYSNWPQANGGDK